MARVIGGTGISHTPSMGLEYDRGTGSPDGFSPGWQPWYEGTRRVQELAERLAPDHLVVVYNDHLNQFDLDNYPTLAIGLGERFPQADEGWGPRPRDRVSARDQASAGDPVSARDQAGPRDQAGKAAAPVPAAPFTVEVPDGLLAGDEAGSGEPVVLIHGFSFDRAMWDPQWPVLAQSFRVIRYDLRGFGSSTPPAAGQVTSATCSHCSMTAVRSGRTWSACRSARTSRWPRRPCTRTGWRAAGVRRRRAPAQPGAAGAVQSPSPGLPHQSLKTTDATLVQLLVSLCS